MRPLSSCRPGSAIRRPASSSNTKAYNKNNPISADTQSDIVSGASDLTTGPALQGNPLKGLMARKKLKNQTKSFANHQHNNTSDFKANNKNDTEIYQELKAWRVEHEK
jgi:hypothetical protein